MIHTSWTHLIGPMQLAMQNSGDDAAKTGVIAAFLAMGVFFICGMAFFHLVINGVICWIVFSAQKRVPREHQKLDPMLVWLNIIPLLPLVWNFFVYSRVPQSLQAALKAQGKQSGDCGQQMGLYFCIAYVAAFVFSVMPLLGLVAFVATIVLCILTLVAISNAAKLLPLPSAGTAPPAAG